MRGRVKRGSAGGSKRGSTGDPPWNFIVGLKHRKKQHFGESHFYCRRFFPGNTVTIILDNHPPFHPPTSDEKSLWFCCVPLCRRGIWCVIWGYLKMKNGAPRDEPKKGHGRGWVVPYSKLIPLFKLIFRMATSNTPELLEARKPTQNPEIPKNTLFTRTFLKSSRELLAPSLWHELGTQQKLFRKTSSDELFYFGWIFSGGFPPVNYGKPHTASVSQCPIVWMCIVFERRCFVMQPLSCVTHERWLWSDLLRTLKTLASFNSGV